VSDVQTGTVTTKVPARLDRLPWSRGQWHSLTQSQITGFGAAIYVLGACLGALCAKAREEDS